MASEQFSLCWDNFHKNMSSGMNSLLENEDLVDVTLAVQGKCLKAHKMVLSVCSPYFKELFKSNPCQHPIVFMKDVSYEALSDLLQFMYQGEVQVSQENLTTFIKTAEALQIKGLTGDGNGSADADVEVPEKLSHPVEEYKPTPRPKKQQPTPVATPPSVKRPRLSISDSQSLPPQITKSEPVLPSQPASMTPDSGIQFKMEPYDQSHSLLDETGDDNFGDDTLDDNTADDNEDYSMMESGVGDEEPQAGTSTEGAGEGQGRWFCFGCEAVPLKGEAKVWGCGTLVRFLVFVVICLAVILQFQRCFQLTLNLPALYNFFGVIDFGSIKIKNVLRIAYLLKLFHVGKWRKKM